MGEPTEVENILQTLGVSYEDLLEKLLKYKHKTDNTEVNQISSQKNGNIKEKENTDKPPEIPSKVEETKIDSNNHEEKANKKQHSDSEEKMLESRLISSEGKCTNIKKSISNDETVIMQTENKVETNSVCSTGTTHQKNKNNEDVRTSLQIDVHETNKESKNYSKSQSFSKKLLMPETDDDVKDLTDKSNSVINFNSVNLVVQRDKENKLKNTHILKNIFEIISTNEEISEGNENSKNTEYITDKSRNSEKASIQCITRIGDIAIEGTNDPINEVKPLKESHINFNDENSSAKNNTCKKSVVNDNSCLNDESITLEAALKNKENKTTCIEKLSDMRKIYGVQENQDKISKSTQDSKKIEIHESQTKTDLLYNNIQLKPNENQNKNTLNIKQSLKKDGTIPTTKVQPIIKISNNQVILPKINEEFSDCFVTTDEIQFDKGWQNIHTLETESFATSDTHAIGSDIFSEDIENKSVKTGALLKCEYIVDGTQLKQNMIDTHQEYNEKIDSAAQRKNVDSLNTSTEENIVRGSEEVRICDDEDSLPYLNYGEILQNVKREFEITLKEINCFKSLSEKLFKEEEKSIGKSDDAIKNNTSYKMQTNINNRKKNYLLWHIKRKNSRLGDKIRNQHRKDSKIRRIKQMFTASIRNRKLKTKQKEKIDENTLAESLQSMEAYSKSSSRSSSPESKSDNQDREAIRNKIMEQLALLRNRRASSFVCPATNSKIFTEPRKETSNSLNGDTEVIESNYYGASDDITSVVDSNKRETEGIHPTKTNDVTKIKGWKNKKFTSSMPETSKASVEALQKPCLHDADPLPDGKIEEETKNINKNSNIISAFASDNLDGFLQSSELNISFEIPTLKKEEPTTSVALKRSKDIIDVIPIPVPQPAKRGRPRLDKFRPRTLAEKKHLMITNKVVKNLKELQKPAGLKETFIYFKDRRVRVQSKTGSPILTCLTHLTKVKNSKSKKEYMYVPYYKRKSWEIKNFKPSIFNNVNRDLDFSKPLPRVSFKPGPLCKKQKLMENISKEEWETIVKTLPSVFLEINPQLGKPIPPKFRYLVESDRFEISENQVELALSALKMKSDVLPTKPISYLVPYANNQTKILLRRRILEKEQVKFKPEKETGTVDEIVSDMLNKMIQYLETKEIENDIIKEDSDFVMLDIKATEPKSKKRKEMDGIEVMNKKLFKRTKTSLELKRLNVKVIEVDIEDKNNDQPCYKTYCKYGCVCLSLNNMKHEAAHCGFLKCMFTCSCNFGSKSILPKVSLPPGTDLLSVGTLNKLQHEAKKDLAKVEREFTQTVIQAKNQTIVVGSNRERNRRVPKAPKKYQDFIENLDILVENKQPFIPVSTPVEEIDYSDYKRPCKVKLARLNFCDIVPFCLMHSKYDCLCLTNPNSTYELETKIEKSPQQKREKCRTKSSSKEEKHFDKEIYCSRTRGMPSRAYINRNRTNFYKKILRKKIKSFEDKQNLHIQNNESLEDTQFLQEIQSIVMESNTNDNQNHTFEDNHNQIVKGLEQVQYDEHTNSEDVLPISEANKNDRRKQTLKVKEHKVEILVDQSGPNKKPNIQRKMKNNAEVPPSTLELNKKISSNKTTSLLMSTMLKLSGKKVDSIVELMPWNEFYGTYISGQVIVWLSTVDTVPKVLMTIRGKRIFNFINIKHLNIPPDNIKLEFLKWLIYDVKPTGGTEQLGVFITLLKQGVWEILGICKKEKPQTSNEEEQNIKHMKVVKDSILEKPSKLNTLTKVIPKTAPKALSKVKLLPKAVPKVLPIIPTTEKILDIPKVHKKRVISPKKCDQFSNQIGIIVEEKVNKNLPKENPPSATTEVSLSRSTMSSARNEVWYYKSTFMPKLLTDGFQQFHVELPGIGNIFRWRMVKVVENLVYVKVNRNDMVFKQVDFKKLLTLSQDSGETVVVTLKDGAHTSNFGLYATPAYKAVFIGPYNITEISDLIISVKKDDSILNIAPWLSQIDKNSKSETPIIDLTEVDSDGEEQKKMNLAMSSSTANIIKSDISPLTKTSKSKKGQPKFLSLLSSGFSSDNISVSLVKKPPKSNEEIFGNSSNIQPAKQSEKPLIRVSSTFNVMKDKNRETSSIDNNIITITCDDEDDVEPTSDKAGITLETILMPTQDISLKKYLVTNLNCLGYVEIHDDLLRNKFVLQFPKGSLMTFDTEDEAVHWFKDKITSNLKIFPKSFILDIKVCSDLPSSLQTPFDSTWLDGKYIAGKFGLLNIVTATDEQLESLNLSVEEFKDLKTFRDIRLMFLLTNQCAQLVMPKTQFFKRPYTIKKIVQTCRVEIKRLEKNERKFLKQKTVLRKKYTELRDHYNILKRSMLTKPGTAHIANTSLDLTEVQMIDSEITPKKKKKTPRKNSNKKILHEDTVISEEKETKVTVENKKNKKSVKISRPRIIKPKLQIADNT